MWKPVIGFWSRSSLEAHIQEWPLKCRRIRKVLQSCHGKGSKRSWRWWLEPHFVKPCDRFLVQELLRSPHPRTVSETSKKLKIITNQCAVLYHYQHLHYPWELRRQTNMTQLKLLSFHKCCDTFKYTKVIF